MSTVSAYQIDDGSLVGGRYRVERKLAQGGMGAIYVAMHEGTGRRIALKVMHPRYVADPKSRGRFTQEARLGSMIASEHIVEVYDAGVDEERGIPYLAMELLEGETVAARLARVGRGRGLSFAEVHEVLRQLASALAAAHARNVVHRDLKPENLFLLPKPDAPFGFNLKVLDFGIAKLLDPSRAAQNVTTAIGTPLWMAPEQNTTAELTPATDVWAVGLIAFRLLTGRFYWRGASGHELDMAMLLDELVRDRLPPASERARELGVADDVPPALDPWFVRCIARDPGARYQDGAELANALAATFQPLLQRPSLVPMPSTRPAPATAEPNVATQSIPQVPSPPIGSVDTQALVEPPRAPSGSHHAPAPSFGPGAPTAMAYNSALPPRDPTIARPRWWLGLIPLVAIIAMLVILGLSLGWFDDDGDHHHHHHRNEQGSSAPALPTTVAPVAPAGAVAPAAPSLPTMPAMPSLITTVVSDVPWPGGPNVKDERDN